MTSYFDEIPDTPTGVTPEQEAKRQVRADARTRSWRTLGQGAIVAVLLAVAGVTGTALSDGVLPDWAAYGALALQAGGVALASYAHRVLSGDSLE
jgi:protein-S-isoprenylcysteine O-methyltransferase Ste14